MSLISGYGQSLFAPLTITGADGKQQKLNATNWRLSDVREFSEKPVEATQSGGAQGLVSGQTLFAAQSLAQNDAQDGNMNAVGKTDKEKFLEFQKMSPAEKYRSMFLAQMGLSEEDLEAMSPEEREKIEAIIEQKVKEQLEEDMRKKELENQQ